MSDMKCPICGSKISVFYGYGEELFSCSNLSCKAGGFYATDNMWQELIRTRKALGMALDWLREVATPAKCNDELCCEFTSRKLAEIKTILEQKDVK